MKKTGRRITSLLLAVFMLFGMMPAIAPMQAATVSRAWARASAAFCPGVCRLEGLPQNCSMHSSMAFWAAGLVLVVAALSK